VGKGYAEGPAADERYEALERGDRFGLEPEHETRHAVYGSTAEDGEKHFIGWVGEVDPDELFTSGKAWGISVRHTTT
jgi:predicted nucleotidyltransferase